MCYPADHYDGVFIPNWAMWFVLELGEYAERTSDRELVARAREKVYALLDYFRRFENEARPSGKAGILGIPGME